MSAPRVLVRDEEPGKRRHWLPQAPDFGWELLGFVGIVFFLSGLLDLFMAGYPFMWGNPDWEFGVIGSILNGLTVPMLGLALMLGAAVARGWRFGIRLFSILAWVFSILIIVLTVFWALNLPLAFKTVQDPLPRQGLKKSVAKTLAQAVLYPAAFIWLGFKGWRYSRAQR